MNEEELTEFLKNNLSIELEDTGYGFKAIIWLGVKRISESYLDWKDTSQF